MYFSLFIKLQRLNWIWPVALQLSRGNGDWHHGWSHSRSPSPTGVVSSNLTTHGHDCKPHKQNCQTQLPFSVKSQKRLWTKEMDKGVEVRGKRSTLGSTQSRCNIDLWPWELASGTLEEDRTDERSWGYWLHGKASSGTLMKSVRRFGRKC